MDEFVDLVIPELQRRGLFRTEYEGKTLRENLALERPENQHAARRGDRKAARSVGQPWHTCSLGACASWLAEGSGARVSEVAHFAFNCPLAAFDSKRKLLAEKLKPRSGHPQLSRRGA